jgi:dihydroneopterin aldolase
METLCKMLVAKIGENKIIDSISVRMEKPDAPFPHPGGLAVVEFEWTRD